MANKDKYELYTFKLGADEITCFALSSDLTAHKYSLTQIYLTVEPNYKVTQAAKRSIEIINTSQGLTLFPQGFQDIETYKLQGKTYRLISEEEVGKFWTVCALLGKYPKACCLLGACAEEGLNRRANYAIGVKVCEEEYNARLKARVEGKQVRWDFTDSIKAYIQRNNITGMEAKFMYKNATDRLYSNLTGYSSTKKLREKENIPIKATPRDYASDRDLKHIAEIEAAAQRYIDLKNIHPYDAIDLVTNQLLLKHIGWYKATRI